MSVRLIGVGKRFGATPAIYDIDLHADSQEFLALLGPSGSGKTTLLRLIAGLELPDTGQILIGGQDMQDVPARDRRAGVVFQSYALFPNMTVGENIAFGLKIRPRSTRPHSTAITNRVAELLELVQMDGFASRYPNQLSGGQRQRVALARALAIEPRVLLLDEPFGALDAQVRKDLRRWLRDLHDRMRLTTVLVTHDQNEAMEMADRVAVLRAGRLEQVDAPAAIWARPANAFVHAFLGDSLQLDCIIKNGAANFAPLPLPPLHTTLADGPAVATIRPHEIRLHLTESGLARVRSVSSVGPLLHVAVTLEGLTVELTILPDGEIPGIGVSCSLDISQAQIFKS